MNTRVAGASRIAVSFAVLVLAACGGGGGGPSGGAVSSPTPVTPSASPVTGFAELIWTAPTQNEDGTALTDLAGYKVRYGQSDGSLSQMTDVSSPGTTTLRIEGLAAGTWYFTVAAYTNTGAESAQAGPVWKTIQ